MLKQQKNTQTAKCKDCKEEYKPSYSNGLKTSTRCFKCLKKHEREKKKKMLARAKERRKKQKEKKANSKSVLTKELDRVFSIFIRQRDKGTCISCGVKREIKEMQNGHYIRRSVMNTRWDEKNCNCQCPRCNVFMGGNYPAYTLGLINKYGEGILKELNDKSNQVKQWTVNELKELIEYYKLNT